MTCDMNKLALPYLLEKSFFHIIGSTMLSNVFSVVVVLMLYGGVHALLPGIKRWWRNIHAYILVHLFIFSWENV